MLKWAFVTFELLRGRFFYAFFVVLELEKQRKFRRYEIGILVFIIGWFGFGNGTIGGYDKNADAENCKK